MPPDGPCLKTVANQELNINANDAFAQIVILLFVPLNSFICLSLIQFSWDLHIFFACAFRLQLLIFFFWAGVNNYL